jgi:peptide/nickel transport system substrate-binding protein
MQSTDSRILTRWLRVVTLAVAALALAGLTWGIVGALAAASSSPAASPSQLVLKVGTTSDLDNANPFVGYSGTSYEVYHLNYDFLIGFGTKLEPRPELATEIPTVENGGISADGKTWTFKIRSGVKWQDGVPFSAADVAFTYNYIIKNELSAYTQFTNHIESVEAPNATTAVFHLTQPKANILHMWVPIVPEHIWSKVPGDKAGTTFQNKTPVIGTGPFQLVEAKKGEFYRMVRNPDYWGTKPTIDEIIFQIYTNADTMTQDLKMGTIDYAWGLPAAQFKGLGGQPGITTNAAPYRYFDELCMNCFDNANSLGNPVLRDEKFRQAISWAVDKNKLVQVADSGYGKVAQGIITPEIPTYYWQPSPEETFGFDLTKAGDMLTAAGYPLKNGVRVDKQGKPISLRLWSRSDDQPSQSAGKLMAGWFRSLGLKITYTVMDTGALSDKLYNMSGKNYAPDYDMYIWGWGQYSDPDYILGVFTTDQIDFWNDACWSNKQYDQLYQQQAQTIDPATRKPIVDQMVKLFYDSAPYIVWDYPLQLEAYNTAKWSGWTKVPTGTGPVLFITDNIDTYLNMKPAVANSTTTTSKSSSTLWIAVGVVVALVVIGLIVWLSRRGRGRAVEE